MVNYDLETPRESATVVILRDAGPEFEVLMLQKHAAINYGGSWVFPGGIVEASDHKVALHQFGSQDRLEVSRAAVIRETSEETGLLLNAQNIQPFSNWLTPKLKIKRYNTLFFITELSGDQAQTQINIDGEEIVAAKWVTPTQAIQAQATGEMALNGPSYVTLASLCEYSNASEATRAMTRGEITSYEPRGIKIATGVATIYPGDALYNMELNDDALANTNGRQHRLYMHSDRPWEFINQ